MLSSEQQKAEAAACQQLGCSFDLGDDCFLLLGCQGDGTLLLPPFLSMGGSKTPLSLDLWS